MPADPERTASLARPTPAPAEPALEPDIRAELRVRASGGPVDRAIAELAGSQHGVVSRAQLTRLGLGRRAIGHRLESGRLHAVHRGVYAVGHRRVPREAAWMAAVLAGGAGAVLSHRSAAALWGIGGDDHPRVEVTVPVAPSRRRVSASYG